MNSMSAGRRSLSPVARWLTAAAAGIALLWAGLLWQVWINEQEALKQGNQEAARRGIAMAEQLDDLIDQSDQLLVTLRFLRMQGTPNAAIEKLFADLPQHSWLSPTYIDSAGVIRLSRRKSSIGASVADQTFFRRVRDNSSEDLTIHPVAKGVGALQGKKVIRLTRRISSNGDRFDGLMSIAVPAEAFTHHREGARSDATDFVMVGFQDGTILASSAYAEDLRTGADTKSRMATAVAASDALSSAQLLLDETGQYFVVRAQLLNHPLEVMVALERSTLLATVATERAHLMLMGLIATLVILAVSGWGSWRYVSQANAQDRARHVRAVFRQAVDDSKDELFMLIPLRSGAGTVADYSIEECNIQAARSCARAREALVGQPLSAILTPANWSATREFLGRAMLNGFAETEAHFYREGAGQKRWMNCRATLVEDGLAVTLRDVTDLKEKEAQLERLALTDGLTGLPNRHWINRELPLLLKRAAHAQEYVAALFIDLDNFKTINDTLGHQTGDDYLKAVAAGIGQVIRKDDVAVRLGGDEFLVLALHLDDFALATRVATDIVERIREVGQRGRWSPANPRASVGIAAFPMDARSATDLVQAADIAMYEAKRNGKDRFEIFVPAMRERLRDEFNLESGLRKAVAEGGLSLRFHPRASAVSGNLIGFEALARWEHPVLGFVPPARFIPVAEKNDLIDDIGCWVVEEVCKTLVGWRESDKLLHPVSVNISAKQLKSSRLREHLKACCERYRIPPAQLELELTESMMVSSDRDIQRELRLLGDMGHKLMIDDFGTGYSSLAQLQQLKVDVLKIDATFVRNLNAGDEGGLICRAMVQIGKTLGIDVVAEGVETRQQLEQLQRFGCDEIQGFLLAEPMTASEATSLLDHRRLFAPDTLEMFPRQIPGPTPPVAPLLGDAGKA